MQDQHETESKIRHISSHHALKVQGLLVPSGAGVGQNLITVQAFLFLNQSLFATLTHSHIVNGTVTVFTVLRSCYLQNPNRGDVVNLVSVSPQSAKRGHCDKGGLLKGPNSIASVRQ